MEETKLVEVANPNGDWYTIYVDGKKVIEGHSVDANTAAAVLKFLGYTVDYQWKELTEECDEKYDGDFLPDDITELEFKEQP